MVDFGFGLVPSSRINLDLFDKEKYAELVEIEPDARICMACGSCTAVCTAGKFLIFLMLPPRSWQFFLSFYSGTGFEGISKNHNFI